MKYQSLAEMFLAQSERYRNKTLYRFAHTGKWQSLSWNEAICRVREMALGLISLGVKRGDRIAIFSNNRVEWNLADWANICSGALTVPVYASSPPAQALHIIEHSEPTILFVDSWERLNKLGSLHLPFGRLRAIVVFEAERSEASLGGATKIYTLAEFREMGSTYGERREGTFELLVHSLRPEDDLTIIYTSGTTGTPKGVLTTHAHYLFMIEAVDAAVPSTDQDVTLHFLPSAHSLGRLEHFMAVAKGWTVGYARSIETIPQDLGVIQPTVIFSVPRIYENAYHRIRLRVNRANLFGRAIFNWALSMNRRWPNWACSLIRRSIFSPVRAGFGGKLRLAISGGAPLPSHIGEFFHAVGILVLEGYGLTETATVSHVNRPWQYKFGTVGLALQGVQCRIASDGEILVRGPNVFKCYFRDLIGTQNVIDKDGWFHTGDIGEIDQDGFLRVTDRKKDLIVTSGGKKVAPQKLENLLKSNPLISQAMVIGSGQKHVVALVTVDQKQVLELARSQGIVINGSAEMASHPWVQSRIREIIKATNKDLAPFEAIRNFCILNRDLTVEAEELTPTLKLRRQVVMHRYKELIDDLYRKSAIEA